MRVITRLKAVKWVSISAFTCLVLLISLPHSSYSQTVNFDSIRKELQDIYRTEINQKVKRSCQAYYVLNFNSVNGQPASTTVNFGGFEARRGCGTFVPNRCRRRARETAIACMNSAWTNRKVLTQREPPECTSVGDAGVLNYSIRGLDGEIERQACQYAARGNRINLSVSGVTQGNTGCGPGDAKSQTIQLGNASITCRSN